uniref:Elongator complex protein 1 n=1 Tax=Anopheles christyi TaxID=43041 RepID=A0A182K8J5_9DIPT
MRNLYRVSHSRFDLSQNGLRSVWPGFTIDQNTDNKFYFVQESGVFCCPLFADLQHPFCEPLLSQADGYENIIALEHLALSDELCCASSNGNVWSYKLEAGVVEEVTHCKHGIRAMQWSPDQELVVFVDGELNVVTMIGSEFEPINEVQLKDDTFGDRQFMSVGWGKKETQFHGSEGKAAAKKAANPSELDIANTIEREPDSSVNISWRADGEYFAVGFLAPFGQRAFKVFNKEGALQYTSEKCLGLESSLAWRPSGNWIAIPQELKDKYVIALFEKNGLRHREIPLTLDPRVGQRVHSLHWSADSDVLAVHWVDQEKRTTGVFLCVIGNYHWYLKQCLTYPSGTSLTGIQWDQRHSAGKTLHMFSSDPNVYERIRFDFRIDRSVGLSEEDHAMVAVIDGKRLLLSSFRQAVIPPPMCGFTLEEKYPINATGFIRTAGRSEALEKEVSSNAFFTVDSLGEITLYEPVLTKTAGRSVLSGVTVLLKIAPGKLKRFNEDFPDQHASGLHFLWLNPERFVMDHNQLRCGVYSIEMQDDAPGLKKIWHMETENTNEIGCIEAFREDSILVELLSGRVLEVDGFTAKQEGKFEISSRNHSIMPVFCEQLFVDRNRYERTVYALAQNRRHLYRDGSLLASDITSALLTENYLLCTTISELKFIALGTAVAVPVTRHPIIGERRVERGSKLVAVVPRGSRTIFQLPRGNLEAINPRVLSLCLIAKHLDALEYYEAFDIMRKERINLNLLVDHDPARFLQHLASHFLRQITNVNWLNLFISDLANQDACQMYESNYLDRATGVTPQGYCTAEKVSFCCDQLLAAMDTDPTVQTLPKVTCYVKQGQLENALALIWTLKQGQQSSEAAEEALRYLLYLVEVNALYDVALGMYDFGLVLFVATKSQKDPKEYLPFLNELKRMDENYRKYRIDCHLKRYGRALEHIARYETDEDRFQEALELITTHQLYSDALRCYKGSTNQDHYRRVCAVYGDYLRKGSKHADASLMYERAGDLQQSISSARHALDWRRVVRLSSGSSMAVEAVLRSLVPGLLEAGEYDAAATIAYDHLKDARLAIECLVKDHRYERALLLAAEPELRETVRTSVGEYLTTLNETLLSEREQFLHQKERLATVREERIRKQAAAAAGADLDDGEGDCGDCDLYSDSSTIASSRHTGTSGRSGKSHRSSKNRRKHERKLLNLKEGNPFEDIALIDALHSLVVRVCGVERQRHIRSICQVAMELLCYDEQAHQLQQQYGALFQLIHYSLDAIWVPEMIVPGMPPTAGADEPVAIGDAPILTPSDLVKAQDSQRYALIKPHQRYKPDVQSISWQWDILK